MALLDRATRRLIERLRLRVRPKATSTRPGSHRSPELAQGLEFADHRQYIPGDDIRHIDWKAYARHGQLSIRRFEEERDARIYVLVDCSASMTRGKPAKIDVARKLAAAYAYAGMKQFDRVSIHPFNAEMNGASRIAQSPDRLADVEAFIEGQAPEGTTSFEKSVRDFAARYGTSGLIVVVSDLMATQGWEGSFKILGRLGHQLTVLRVACEEDDDPDFRGELDLRDSETGDHLRLKMSDALIEAYKEEVAAHISECRRSAISAGGAFFETPVEVDAASLIRMSLGRA